MQFLRVCVRSVAALLVVSAAGAAPLTYILDNHPDANLFTGSPNLEYGLRWDTGSPDQLFSVGPGPFNPANPAGSPGGGAVLLTYDPLDVSFTPFITGRLYEHGPGSIWSVRYDLSGITLLASGGFEATGGQGSVTLLDAGGNPTATSIFFVGKQDGGGVAFAFDSDCWRLDACTPGEDDSWVGRGWLWKATSSFHELRDQTHGTNDWLVTARFSGTDTFAPEPSTWLMTAAGAGLFFLKRRGGSSRGPGSSRRFGSSGSTSSRRTG